MSSAEIADLSEAMTIVQDGAHVALTGFAITRNVIASVHELIRAGRRGLTVTQCIGGMDTDLLAGAGCIDHLNYSGGSLDRFGFLNGVNAAVASGQLHIEEYSSLALALRLHAAGLGLPFISTSSMRGSDLLEPLLASGVARLIDHPFGDGEALVLPPLRPDVAIVHADVVDRRGNAVISGPTWTIRETALAARAVIVQCEEVVPEGEIDPGRVLIPATVVDVVAPVPQGAHPTAVYGCYDYDRRALEEYVRLSSDGPDGMQKYLDEYVLGTDNFHEYLRKVRPS